MKKTLSILIALVLLTSMLTACNMIDTARQFLATPTPRPSPTATPESAAMPEDTTTDEPEDDASLEARPPQDYIEGTDILPERWQGEWVVIFSDANYFDEDDSIYIIGYDNEVLYTDSSGRENKRWFSYNEENNTIHIHNEPPPFNTDSLIRDSFELRRESTNELIFMRYEIGQEVRFERVNPTEPDNVLWTAPLVGSDPLPESWQGEWIVVHAERYFEEGETIIIKDFDNAVLYLDNRGWEHNRWFGFSDAEQTIDIYNEPPPFLEDGWIRESFEIRSMSDDEITLRRVGFSQDVRLERVS
jgi:hypothetical protein